MSYLQELRTISLSNISLVSPYVVYIIFALSTTLSLAFNERLELSDKLIQSAFYSGKKINKITYEEIASSNRSYIGFPVADSVDIISNIYSDYFEEGRKYGDFPRVKDIKVNSTRNTSSHTQSSLTSNLYKLYGKTTVFKVDLIDLDKMINSSIISEGQAIFFWEILLQEKIDCLRNVYGKMIHETSIDIYLFNFLPIKETIFIILSLILLYVFMIRTYSLNIKCSFTINCIGVVAMFYIIEMLYKNKHYFSSSLIFIQLIYFLKCSLDSFALGLGYSRDDFEIFSQNLSAKNLSQFILKFVILLIMTVFTGVFSICRFQFYINYFIFYLSLFTLIVFISNCFESEAPLNLQPIKNVLIFLFGLFNFLISKFHKSITQHNFKQVSITKNNEILSGVFPDSLCLISDLFTMFCFHYLNGYIYTQTKPLIVNKVNKPFTIDDILWSIGIIISSTITCIGLIKGEYVCFILSMYLNKILLNFFTKVYNVKFSRAIIDIIFFNSVYINHIITVKADEYIASLFFSNSFNLATSYSGFTKSLCRCIGLIQILYMLFINFDYIYSSQYERSPELEEMAEEAAEEIYRKVEIATRADKKKLNQFKSFQIHVIRPEKKMNLMSFAYIHFDFGYNYINICLIFYLMKKIESNYIALILYTAIVIVLFARVFFILSEFRSNSEYLYAYIITLILSIRLLVLTKGTPVLYFMSHANVLCLILLYCMIDRRKNIVTVLIIIHLYASSFVLKSNFLFIDLLSLLFVPITFSIIHNQNYSKMSESFNDNDDNTSDSNNCGGYNDGDKGNGNSFIFLFPVAAVFTFQLYGFKNVLGLMEAFNGMVKSMLFDIDVMKMFVSLNYDEKKNEFALFEVIMNSLQWLFKIKAT